MKVKFCSIVGVIGSSIIAFVGRGGTALETLILGSRFRSIGRLISFVR